MRQRWCRVLGAGAVCGVVAAAALAGFSPSPHSGRGCSTVVMARGGALLVGHNLDSDVPLPGLVVSNPAGVAKECPPWREVAALRSGPAATLRWRSRYASLTYNVAGRELPDGGLNEAGLAVGEASMAGTRYPEGSHLAGVFPDVWLQYLLDTCATVDEALSSLDVAVPAGLSGWHVLLADAAGGVAVLEFHDGVPRVFRGPSLPVPVLCNRSYGEEVELLRVHRSTGARAVKDCTPRDTRFLLAAEQLASQQGAPAPGDVFSLLQKLDCGNNRWQVVLDLPARRLLLRTERSPRVRSLALRDLPRVCPAPALLLDVDADLEGDVSHALVAFDQGAQERAVARALATLHLPRVAHRLLKPRLAAFMSALTARARCPAAP